MVRAGFLRSDASLCFVVSVFVSDVRECLRVCETVGLQTDSGGIRSRCVPREGCSVLG